MTSKRELLRQQRRWAESVGLQPDSRGYLETYEQNLRCTLSARTLAAFQRGSGSELEDTPHRPAKMRALHSSSALAVNFFDHWSETDAGPLLQVLGLDSTLVSLDFERQFPTGLPGTPPNVDVALELGSGSIIGIESKFTEWLAPKRKSKAAFKDKYFESGATNWTDRGLSDCQSLAADMQRGAEHYRFLDAPQLLKHALGLATSPAENFSLFYVYFDVPSAASETHQDDLERFTERVGQEVRFKAIRYQGLVEDLCSIENVDSSYLEYLRSRYAG